MLDFRFGPCGDAWARVRRVGSTTKTRRVAKAPGARRPRFLSMRYAAVYARAGDWEPYVTAVTRQGAQFENLFRDRGGAIAEGPPLRRRYIKSDISLVEDQAGSAV